MTHQPGKTNSIRGLDERTNFAIAKILTLSNPDEGNDAALEAMFEAECLGFHEYGNGITAAPIMFLDEPDLLGSWERGQAERALSDEMDDCSNCQDNECLVCPTHG